jgi:hypothetical protein
MARKKKESPKTPGPPSTTAPMPGNQPDTSVVTPPAAPAVPAAPPATTNAPPGGEPAA